jgi:hypothetical protein
MINQVKVASEVLFFAKDLMEKWNLKEYYDKNKPCLFFGVYSEKDVNIIKSHNGLKIVWFTNHDTKNLLSLLVGVNNLVVNHTEGLKIVDGIIFKKTSIAIKDFSKFEQTPFGEHIYCYIGDGKLNDRYGYLFLKKIEKMIPFNVIYGKLGYSLDYIIDNYYNKSFININITETGRSGLTTLTEMGFMGRYSISNTLDNFPCVIRYTNIEDIINIINNESGKIGTTQPSLLENHFYTGEEWKDVDFWLN